MAIILKGNFNGENLLVGMSEEEYRDGLAQLFKYYEDKVLEAAIKEFGEETTEEKTDWELYKTIRRLIFEEAKKEYRDSYLFYCSDCLEEADPRDTKAGILDMVQEILECIFMGNHYYSRLPKEA